MKFKQLEDGYFQSEDGCLCIPNAPGNRHFDRISGYMETEAKALTKAGYIDIPDDWQKLEPIKEVIEQEQPAEDDQPIE